MRKIFILIITSIIIVLSVISYRNIKADTDLDNALFSAPLGVSISGIFTPGTQSGNVAKVQNVTNPSSTGTDAIVLTTATKNKLGAIWSTDSNYFDLSKDQVASMWMYFGNRGIDAGDGMALVLQNDTGGLKAFGYKGQALNAYGNDSQNYSSESKIASTAIQNSWALEFDTYLNHSDGRSHAGDAASFDLGNKSNHDNAIIDNGHMASTYPGDPTSYIRYVDDGGLLLGTKYWYGMYHNGLINDVIKSDGAWHHVTLTWDKDDQTMTYAINDKKLDGTPVEKPELGYDYHKQTVPLDLTKLGSSATSTGHIRYGFTGSTGSNYANNVVIFDQVPDLVNADVTASVFNVTTNTEVKDGDNVAPDDILRYTYTPNYYSGKQAWQNVRARMQLAQPDAVTFKDYSIGNPGSISYANGTTESINVLTEMDNNNYVQHTLSKNLELTNHSATITMLGRAINHKNDTDKNKNEDRFVDNSLSRFVGNNNIEDIETPSYYIRHQKEMTLSVPYNERPNPTDTTEGATTIDSDDKEAVINPIVGFPNGDAGDYYDRDNVKFKITLNGQSLSSDQYEIGPVEDDDDSVFPIIMDSSLFNSGENKLKIIATYTGNSQSNQIDYIITKKDLSVLEFDDTSNNSSFEPAKLNGKIQNNSRSNDWTMKIIDTRNGTTGWKLYANSSTFIDENQYALNGDVVYKDNNETTPITDIDTLVASNTTDEKPSLISVIDNIWTKESGLLLQTNSKSKPGFFVGNITWTLIDAP